MMRKLLFLAPLLPTVLCAYAVACEPDDTTSDAPSCPACPSELPAGECPALPAAELEVRCAKVQALPHVLSAGCWDGACPLVVQPNALYLGPAPCAQGSQDAEVQLYCW